MYDFAKWFDTIKNKPVSEPEYYVKSKESLILSITENIIQSINQKIRLLSFTTTTISYRKRQCESIDPTKYHDKSALI